MSKKPPKRVVIDTKQYHKQMDHAALMMPQLVADAIANLESQGYAVEQHGDMIIAKCK